jgi:hypothetical protein
MQQRLRVCEPCRRERWVGDWELSGFNGAYVGHDRSTPGALIQQAGEDILRATIYAIRSGRLRYGSTKEKLIVALKRSRESRKTPPNLCHSLAAPDPSCFFFIRAWLPHRNWAPKVEHPKAPMRACMKESRQMTAWELGRYALCFSIAVAMLAGCSGSQPPIGAPGAVPQNHAIATHAEHGGSWMRPGASNNEDLLYVANEGEAGSQGMDVAILTYPQGQLFGTISGIGPPWGVCSDRSGNVWVITSPDNAYEFAHGDTTPIAYLQVPDTYLATGCSVDRTTGNLAVPTVSKRHDSFLYSG